MTDLDQDPVIGITAVVMVEIEIREIIEDSEMIIEAVDMVETIEAVDMVETIEAVDMVENDSEGAYSLIKMIHPPKHGPVLHIH
jgi:hypothetical protein